MRKAPPSPTAKQQLIITYFPRDQQQKQTDTTTTTTIIKEKRAPQPPRQEEEDKTTSINNDTTVRSLEELLSDFSQSLLLLNEYTTTTTTDTSSSASGDIRSYQTIHETKIKPVLSLLQDYLVAITDGYWTKPGSSKEALKYLHLFTKYLNRPFANYPLEWRQRTAFAVKKLAEWLIEQFGMNISIDDASSQQQQQQQQQGEEESRDVQLNEILKFCFTFSTNSDHITQIAKALKAYTYQSIVLLRDYYGLNVPDHDILPSKQQLRHLTNITEIRPDVGSFWKIDYVDLGPASIEPITRTITLRSMVNQREFVAHVVLLDSSDRDRLFLARLDNKDVEIDVGLVKLADERNFLITSFYGVRECSGHMTPNDSIVKAEQQQRTEHEELTQQSEDLLNQNVEESRSTGEIWFHPKEIVLLCIDAAADWEHSKKGLRPTRKVAQQKRSKTSRTPKKRRKLMKESEESDNDDNDDVNESTDVPTATPPSTTVSTPPSSNTRSTPGYDSPRTGEILPRRIIFAAPSSSEKKRSRNELHMSSDEEEDEEEFHSPPPPSHSKQITSSSTAPTRKRVVHKGKEIEVIKGRGTDEEYDKSFWKEGIYVVESILSKRPLKRKKSSDRSSSSSPQFEYLVKWEGYSPKFNSWVPQEDILDISLVREFEKKFNSSTTTTISLREQ